MRMRRKKNPKARSGSFEICARGNVSIYFSGIGNVTHVTQASKLKLSEQRYENNVSVERSRTSPVSRIPRHENPREYICQKTKQKLLFVCVLKKV